MVGDWVVEEMVDFWGGHRGLGLGDRSSSLLPQLCKVQQGCRRVCRKSWRGCREAVALAGLEASRILMFDYVVALLANRVSTCITIYLLLLLRVGLV